MRNPFKRTRPEIRDAIHEYLSTDWANRSLPLDDRIDGIQSVLEEKGIKASKKEVQTAIENQPLSLILRAGIILMGLVFFFRITGVPEQYANVFLGIYGLMLILLLTSSIGGHFQRFRSPKK
ncbi:MAG: hypothetical protein CMO55_06815 [Verrucomicrobiales bacterium]|nr:hypothetical protein [Verrucomicrobiales bacterium]